MSNTIDYSTRQERIKQEWEKFVNGEEVNQEIVLPMIYRSWKRSRDYGIDPYKNVEGNILKDDKMVDELTDCSDLLQEYGQIIDVIREMAGEMGLICRISDQKAKTQKIIASPEIIKDNIKKGNFFALDASEKLMGTNALSLAIRERRPVQVLGAEHYNYYFHNINCSAAPIHNEKGEVAGVINISTNNILNTTIQTLGFVISIAKVLDNNLYINSMLDRLNIKNETLSEIMERLPSGIVYYDSHGNIQGFNQELLKLLSLKNKNEDLVKKEIMAKIKALNLGSDSFNNKEMFLKVNNRKKSFLVSKKEIGSKDSKSNILLLDPTSRIMKIHDTIKSNSSIYNFDDIQGENGQLKNAIEMAKTVADSDSPIVIYGESGTGKELFAHSIHNASSRKDGPFIGINCGAIPSELIESELFGYEPGAFTGASNRGKHGKVEVASNGTLFLDEIESMPLNVQIKLLRVLSTNKITRIGGNEEIPIDIRLISSTKNDLLEEAEKGNFREDLYYRINVFTLQIPPLRERLDDIPLLVNHFISMLTEKEVEVDDKFYDALTSYSWQGNIRELKNVIERAIVLQGDNDRLTFDYLPENIKENYLNTDLKENLNTALISTQKKPQGTKTEEDEGLLKKAEELAVSFALKKEKGNLTKAAKLLGIARSTLYEKINKSNKLQYELELYK
ncbi:sigma-54-dependent Fis family transcriptional regulator [Natranaerofaba carboxydovora]|uniref:sigma-54-dependent Fis family transcriptional regulator n=1 Tax=Natranaerofaba carboxydovora TaxID=2742683 RepID=UPI001F147293|nr:sigma 54-interacting transcriptional regulator [Natranaerofaba carboxydovora]UMZ72674.1 Acetoin dehydrogenase operon transcriptional activator AcoR [Natranaerofaba carboxydovora]